MNRLRLTYLKGSIEISRLDYKTNKLAMWNIVGANHYAFPDHTTLTLEAVKAIRVLGLKRAAEYQLRQHQASRKPFVTICTDGRGGMEAL